MEFPEVFKGGIGLLNHGKLSLPLKIGTQLEFLQPCKLSLTWKLKVEDEID